MNRYQTNPYSHIHITPIPTHLSEVLDEGSTYNAIVKAETKLALAAPALKTALERIRDLHGNKGGDKAKIAELQDIAGEALADAGLTD